MTLGITPECLFIAPSGKWVSAPMPAKHQQINVKVVRHFSDLCLFYANLICYGRVLMGIAAMSMTIMCDTWVWTIAALIMGSVLLDWIDGPVARKYGQSTVMGCGWDWLGDITAQYAIAVLVTHVGVAGGLNPLFVLFHVVFTAVEISTGLFDFATSCKGFYPAQTDTANLPWYLYVEHLLTPNQTYSNAGTVAWLINTIWPLAVVLGAPYWFCAALFPLAMAYAWLEVSQLAFVISSWVDIAATPATGMEFMRGCIQSEIELLSSVNKNTLVHRTPLPSAVARVYWHNLYYENKWVMQFDQQKELLNMVTSMIKEFFPGEKRYIYSMSFITSPANGKFCQEWHKDYADDVSNLFIPLTPITHRNALQFVRGSRTTAGYDVHNQTYQDPNVVMVAENLEQVEICQKVTSAFGILKLFPGVMHRGIANLEDYDRIMFCVSTGAVELTDWSLMAEATGTNHMPSTSF